MKSQEANAIPLREILEKYGHEPVRSYHGYLMYSSLSEMRRLPVSW